MGLLEEKVIVVTGGGAGVGRGIALEAARQGANLVLPLQGQFAGLLAVGKPLGRVRA